jgi:NAD(P)-dependent dehydrogenase (short-subunit alcohol dehydrogenase family)
MTDVTTSQDLAGRGALVTGASRGIGLAIAAELLTRGASVTITARKPDELGAAAERLVSGAAGGDAGRVLAVAGNAGSADAREEAVARTVEKFGNLAVLVNNTGINPSYGSLMDADLDAVRKIFDVNVVAALGFVQLAYKAWMAEHGGAVVNLASVAGIRSSGVIAAYGASKAALIRLTEELAWQLGPSIRVNAVAPAIVKTKFATALYAEDEEKVSAAYPMKRLPGHRIARLGLGAPWFVGHGRSPGRFVVGGTIPVVRCLRPGVAPVLIPGGFDRVRVSRPSAHDHRCWPGGGPR